MERSGLGGWRWLQGFQRGLDGRAILGQRLLVMARCDGSLFSERAANCTGCSRATCAVSLALLASGSVIVVRGGR